MSECSYAILVLSCDKYADLWPGFFKCFWKNFPQINCPIYLGSNTIKYEDKRIISILSGMDVNWSSTLKNILNQIPESKIFLLLEDTFISTKIDEKIFQDVFKFADKEDIKYIRYWENPIFSDIETSLPYVRKIPKGAPYRISVCGIWDRNYLLNILLDGESPWNFEIHGSYRTSYLDGFYSVTYSICEHINMVEKGKWIPSSLKWAILNGLPVNSNARESLKGNKRIFSCIQFIIFRFMLYIPWQLRLKIMNFFRKLLISY